MTFGVGACVDKDDICYESRNDFIEMHDLDETLLGR